MNTKIVIYDDSCPLCAAYTNAFIQTGLIEKNGRKDFSSISPDLSEKIDLKRAVNEIPVIDTTTGQVWYGIDALLEILHQKIPFIKTAANVKPVKRLLLKLYKFISYNRRVIVAGTIRPGTFDCTPDFNIRYRITFIITFLITSASLLAPLQQLVLSNSIFHHTSFLQLVWACVSLVVLNAVITIRLNIKDILEYLGQLTMLFLIILLLTIPLIVLNNYLEISSGSNSFYLGMLTIFSAKEYKRRMQFINFIQRNPNIITISVLTATAFIIYLIL